MQAPALPTVTIDLHPRYAPQPFRDGQDKEPPKNIVLHAQAKWFLQKAAALKIHHGIGFCGVMTVHDPPTKGDATIYLWPLQTPHTVNGSTVTTVAGMEDQLPWPADAGFPQWADALLGVNNPALHYFQQADKNLHVIVDGGTRYPAHEQLQQAVKQIEHNGLQVIGFSLYFNLADASVGDNIALRCQRNHHLLRLLSRSQNRTYFKKYPLQHVGKVPNNWANAMKLAFDQFFQN